MGKYAFLGGYTSESWARMIQNPGDRTAAIRVTLESVGAKLESFHWAFGDDDCLLIFEAPDDLSAAAGTVAAMSSGAFRNARTLKLITPQEGQKLLDKAKVAAAAFRPPGVMKADSTLR